ncbi:MAG: type IX secretion system plug protein domain-containing protein [Acidobacteriota bacterium]
MKKMLIVLLVLAAFGTMLHAQTDREIFGLRVFANNDEYLPPVLAMKSDYLTIEFDVATPVPNNYQIIFQHASKEWEPDENAFLNSPLRDRSVRPLSYTASPGGVRSYTFHFRNSFPDPDGMVQFPYSGNYLFRIVNRDDEKKTLAEGRFIVAEKTLPLTFRLANRYYPGDVAPMNQRLYAAVDMNADSLVGAAPDDRIMHQFLKSVYIFQNWNITRPFRIDVDDRDPDTFVENFMLPNKRFWIRSIPAGNEYRRLDLSSVKLYPNGQTVRLVDGPDQSRMLWQGKNDANGAAKVRPFTGINSEYLDVEFRLRLASRPQKDIFLVGAMTGWEVLPEYKLKYDEATGLYTLRASIRRGVYDYQYVLGAIDASGSVGDQDWIALEGNDWRTISRYIAVAYYRDQRFGGFDRAIGMAVAKSPGGQTETSLEAQPEPRKPKTR